MLFLSVPPPPCALYKKTDPYFYGVKYYEKKIRQNRKSRSRTLFKIINLPFKNLNFRQKLLKYINLQYF